MPPHVPTPTPHLEDLLSVTFVSHAKPFHAILSVLNCKFDVKIYSLYLHVEPVQKMVSISGRRVEGSRVLKTSVIDR